ncbi:MAG: glycosyltransferase [Bacteroidales bacterium]|nr:glycosyltransferase [Bacteroidales bacterium]
MDKQTERIIFIAEDISFPVDEGMKKFNYFLLQYLQSHYTEFKLYSFTNDYPNVNFRKIKSKSFISLKLFSDIRNFHPRLIIYSPFSSGTLYSFLRLFVINLASKSSKTIIINLQRRSHNGISKKIINLIRPYRVAVFSRKDHYYFTSLGIDTAFCRTGVDMDQFVPVSTERKGQLRRKYGLNESDKIILHIGHLKPTRNIDILKLLLKEGNEVVIVGSTSTSQDKELKNDLENAGVKIFDGYIEHIEELYQLSDVYVFPVKNDHSAIEFPLSVLEAMACNLPVVTTSYGSLPDFFIQSTCFTYFNNREELFSKVKRAFRTGCNNRNILAENFSWENVFEEFFTKI